MINIMGEPIPTLHKKMKKTLPNVMGFDFKANLNWMTGSNQGYIPKWVLFFSIFFTLRRA
jgi:hypothetical protein